MSTIEIFQTLARLRAAADNVRNAFPKTRWTKVSGPGPDTIELDGSGGFHGLTLTPGSTLTLRCELDLPAEVAGIGFKGEPLEGVLNSLYPVDIEWNGKPVFSDKIPPVAAGPSLFTVIPCLRVGKNGTIQFRVHSPNHQMTRWVGLRFTTPSLRARFEMLDVAWAQLVLADALAVTPQERKAVERAASLVPQPLVPADGKRLAAAFKRMTDALEPLADKARGLRVHLIGHSHIDMNWLWTWPDTVEVIKRDFRNVLALMDEFPELTFSHSQPATYEVLRREEPKLFARVLQHIKRGRWELLTMQWVEGDLNMASGEAQARQILEAVTYSRNVLGAAPTTFHAPDSFGHPGNLPQLAVSAGAQRYYHHRCNRGQENLWPAYWWEGQDGTRLLAISTPSYNGEISAGDLANAAIRALRFGQRSALHFHGIGDHGGGPSRQNLQALRRLQKLPLLPTAFCSTTANYARELLDAGAVLPTHRGESSTIFEGCYTTHADTKLYNRHGENLLCTADTLAAVAGLNRNAALTEAWRKVLFNQFHDILDGSAIHEAYEKTAVDFEEAKSTATAVTAEALTVLERGLAAGRIAVTNPLGFERQDWVVVPGLKGEGIVWLVGGHGHVTPGQFTSEGLGFVARVPAFGTVGYRVEHKTPASVAGVPPLEAVPSYAPTDTRQDNLLGPAPQDAPYLRVETAVFRVYVRRDCGILVSFFDKRVGRELVGFGMRRGSDYIDTARPDLALNVFQFFEELPHGMSAWQLHEVHREHSLLRGATTRVVETGPVRCVLEVAHKLRKSTIAERIIFYRELPRVDFHTVLEWQEIGNGEVGVPGLKVAFTARLPQCEAWFETPFAAVQRPADGQEVPALRWADVGGSEYGFALLNDCKYGYDALGSRLRLTLVRSGYDPDAISDVGHHEIRYSFLPHPGNWRDAGVVRVAAGFNQPLLARVVKKGGKAARAVLRPALAGDSSVQIACLKRPKYGDGMIVRLYESAGTAVETRLCGLPAGARVWETNIVEDRQQLLAVHDGSVALTFRPWQMRTLLIEVS